MAEELEWQTRKDRIDKRLTNLKPEWKIIRYKDGLETGDLDRYAVGEFPTANGPADYALFVNGQLLGIIEAKKVSQFLGYGRLGKKIKARLQGAMHAAKIRKSFKPNTV